MAATAEKEILYPIKPSVVAALRQYTLSGNDGGGGNGGGDVFNISDAISELLAAVGAPTGDPAATGADGNGTAVATGEEDEFEKCLLDPPGYTRECDYYTIGYCWFAGKHPKKEDISKIFKRCPDGGIFEGQHAERDSENRRTKVYVCDCKTRLGTVEDTNHACKIRAKLPHNATSRQTADGGVEQEWEIQIKNNPSETCHANGERLKISKKLRKVVQRQIQAVKFG